MTTIKEEYITTELNLTHSNPMVGMIKSTRASRKNWKLTDRKNATYAPQLLVESDKYTLADLGRGKKVIAYVDPSTDLLVTDSIISGIQGRDLGQTDIDFAKLYIKTAKQLAYEDLEKFKETGEFNMTVPKGSAVVRVYKPYDQLRRELFESFEQDEIMSVLYYLNQYRNQLPTKASLDALSDGVNSWVTFETTHPDAPNYVPSSQNTLNLPYTNPAICEQLSSDERAIVDTFLDEFFDETNKRYVSSYLGAALMNVNVKALSKYLVVQGEQEVGKSVLFENLIRTVFQGFYNIQSSFDDLFDLTNKHAAETIRNSRVTLYKEANWHGQNSPEIPNFHGLHANNIKTMVSDGSIVRNPKYKAINGNAHMTGVHIILTNYTPVIKPQSAYDRRFIVVHLKDNTMSEKGENLGLLDEASVEQYLNDYVELFARYFVEEYNNNPKLIINTERISSTYNITKLPPALQLIFESLAEEQSIDLSVFKTEIISVLNGYRNFNARITDDILYLNVTKDNLDKYGDAKAIRNKLIEEFGQPVQVKFSINGTKHNIRCVKVPLSND